MATQMDSGSAAANGTAGGGAASASSTPGGADGGAAGSITDGDATPGGASAGLIPSIPPHENYGKIDASAVASNTQLWLAKCPRKLAEAFESAPEGTVLGQLVFTKGGPAPGPGGAAPAPGRGRGAGRGGINGGRGVVVGGRGGNQMGRGRGRGRGGTAGARPPVKQSLTLIVSEDVASAAGAAETARSSNPNRPGDPLPLDYTVEALTRKVPVLHPFTRNAVDGSVTLHGTVGRSCALQMQRTERYRKLCRTRVLSAVMGQDRFVRPVEASELSEKRTAAAAGAGAGTSAGFGDAIQRHGKRIIEAAERASGTGAAAAGAGAGTAVVGADGKKRKFEGQSVRSIVFELFSIQPYWTVKELRSASGRAEKDLRPVLAELCEFRRSGEQKGTWELKKEFRMQEDGAGGGTR